jgi:uncharacterized membrane protein (UPF0127 family)
MSKRKKRHKSARSDSLGKKTTAKRMLIAVFFVLSAVAGYYVISTPKTVDIWIGDCRVKAEIADNPELRAKGLSGRRRLPDGHGMVFVFQYTRKQSFWMKDTSIPLSIAFISAEGTIRQVEQMNPFDLSKVASHSPVQYALEVNQGFFKKNGISVGMHADLSNATNR